mmetsp:Transcript_18034/g.36131  ORF Transcript_18034/g.36131 Transcript_18034/m.36131 type:complete len:295 (-) Transcript_18034:61-945(-)
MALLRLLPLLLVLLLLPTPALSSAPLPPSSLLSRSYSTSLNLFTPHLQSWSSRASRGLLVPDFGAKAQKIREQVEECYDGMTLTLAATSAAERRAMKKKLMSYVDSQISALHSTQLASAYASTRSKFKKSLLSSHRVSRSDGSSLSPSVDSSSLLRSSCFSFQTAAEKLDVPSLSLSHSPSLQSLSEDLARDLDDFPTSNAFVVKSMASIKSSASKPKPPQERGIKPTFHLTSMFRPDGFGNLQAFLGYSFSNGNGVTVGVCNDADSPEVMGQFGGERPPLVRVQPKVHLDVDL